jgi:hypothetical protein
MDGKIRALLWLTSSDSSERENTSPKTSQLRHNGAILIAETRVRFPSPAPLIINDLRKSAGKVQENRVVFLLDHSASAERQPFRLGACRGM